MSDEPTKDDLKKALEAFRKRERLSRLPSPMTWIVRAVK